MTAIWNRRKPTRLLHFGAALFVLRQLGDGCLCTTQRYAVTVQHDGCVALEIRCAGNGGRCRRVLGLARVIASANPIKSVLHLTNEGWATSNGYPLLEDVVPADFLGSTGIFACPIHGFLITERTGEKLPVPGLPPGRWAHGMSVQLPFALLRKHYQDFLNLGRIQVMRWVPTKETAILLLDTAQRPQ